jgi:ABC-2 type transport system ATP-binding protein
LGPNGAGKTTTVEMIEGLRVPDSGSITVFGLDVHRHKNEVKERIGVQLQVTSVYERLRVGEAIELFGSYYHRRRPANEILEETGLTEKVNAGVETLSGGQKQRLALGLALVNDPELLFLDEPTTGLDPQARRNTWETIRHLKSTGKTILLTTHYMEEAEYLCDRVMIIDQGRSIALDTPTALISRLDVERRIEFVSEDDISLEMLSELPGVDRVEKFEQRYILYSTNVDDALHAILPLTRSTSRELKDLHVRRATLEDVFLELTGRRLRE